MRMKIGIDLDNTIACYSEVFAVVARELNYLPADFCGDKVAVKAAISLRPDGEREWMRVQGQVYGKYMGMAVAFPHFRDFVLQAKAHDAELLIISHKTEYGHFDEAKVNLRAAARLWLSDQRIAGDGGVMSADQVYFTTTREEKIERIAAEKCTHFIDDLLEVLTDPHFPGTTRRYLFGPIAGSNGLDGGGDWSAIGESIFCARPLI